MPGKEIYEAFKLFSINTNEKLQTKINEYQMKSSIT